MTEAALGIYAGFSGPGCCRSGNVKRFRGGLVCKAHRWLYPSTLGSRVIKKEKKFRRNWLGGAGLFLLNPGDCPTEPG